MCVLLFLSFGYRVETVRTHYKRRTNIKTWSHIFVVEVLHMDLCDTTINPYYFVHFIHHDQREVGDEVIGSAFR